MINACPKVVHLEFVIRKIAVHYRVSTMQVRSLKSTTRVQIMDLEYVSDFFKIDAAYDKELQNTSASTTKNSQGSDIETLNLSQLDIEEVEPLVIPHFYNISPRQMPPSPHHVFEEEFSNNPWILLVAAIFLTKTTGKTARPFMKRFFEEFPTPYRVLDVCPSRLETFFDSLGLRKRGIMIWKMTYQFVSAKWRRASDLFGVGKYGEDAYRIFILGHTDLDPDDRYLRLYLDWLRGQTSFLEDAGVEGCEFPVEDPVLMYYLVTLRDLPRI